MSTPTSKLARLLPPLNLLAILCAGPVLTLMIIGQLVTLGYWGAADPSAQVKILGNTLLYTHIMLGMVLAALTAGLVRGFKIGIGKASAEIDLVDDQDSIDDKRHSTEE